MTHDADRLNQAVSELSEERRALLLSRLGTRQAERARAEEIPRRPPGTDRLPCSAGQERLYYLHQLDPGSVTYLLPIRLRLRGTPDPAALRVALAGLVARHEPLRTGFEVDAEHVPSQVVRAAGEVPVPLAEGAGTAAEVDAHVRRLTGEPFDLATPPLLRAGLWRVTDRPDEWVLALCVHHAVIDGWSLGVLVEELAELYDAAVAARPPELPELPVQYGDYTLWQRDRRADAVARDLDFWRQALDGAPPLELAGDRPRPVRPTFGGASVPVRIEPALAGALDARARAAEATPFMVLLAAFTVVLRRWSGQPDLVVGTPVAGRSRPELERLVGFFVNTLVLRVDLAGARSFGELVDRVRTACLAGFAHQDVPFEQVVREAGVTRQGGRPDLPRALFALRNVPLGAPRLSGLEVVNEELPRVGTDLDLSLELAPDGDGGYSGWLVYATDLFDAGTAERMVSGLRAVLTAVAGDTGLAVAAIPVLPPAERDRVLTGSSGAAVPAVAPTTMHALVAAQADRTPDAIAVAGGRPLTYRELDDRANRLAATLAGHGVRREDRVGVHLHRGPDLLVALLGVLKSGAVYLPLDPDQPAERLDLILRDADPSVVVTSPGLAGAPAVTGRATVLVTETAGATAGRPDVLVDPANAACLLYTSGSTGTPKGALLTHHGVANRMGQMVTGHGFGPGDVVLQKTPIGSDPSLWEMLVPVCAGGRVVFADPGRHTDAGHLLALMREHRVTACDFVPSMLVTALADPRFAESVASLRLVVCGGEELPAPAAERFLELAPGAVLTNYYGPTEVSFDATAAAVTRPVRTPVPIGRPLAGVEAYVLDADGEVTPAGVPGELFLGGVQLTRGYLDRPGHTAETLVPHPFRAGDRLYRTGDRVRRRPDGELDFLGRLDSQVKIRGYRVEPGEVESALRTHADVEHVAVRVFTDETGPRLAGYLTVRAGVTPPDAGALRRHLATRLPAPMIPAAFVVLDELPLLPNGKVDRSRLPEPGRTAVESVPPETSLQKVLCHIWEQVLDAKDIGVHDDFFVLGGHSLLATQVVSQVREVFRMDFPLHFFVETPTVAAFATLLRERGVAAGVDVDKVAGIVLRVRAMSAAEVGDHLGSETRQR
ncbi:amino acid adenylation domain-containing protein [Amycolatopsis sp. DG1A-15b]|uniref:non-ribosomal peptide synthetase n=1 Tax=Amycolatopsis sp. DG1A-15b TaxID=3052846 RepID=UPI00255B9FA5|nr:amino acid adenylation domain-containing protein [Amycolatopsis sp. DG1A-15b]WIX93030.1 amino acid adenylation domain-containing protein [Amycolatopsis sp. DG1A-15b]